MALKAAGQQNLSAVGTESQPIQPSANGVTAKVCEMLIQNTGTTDVWLRADSSQTSDGHRIEPEKTVIIEEHTSDDDDLHVFFEDASGGQVDVLFRTGYGEKISHVSRG